jgi:hypothetical protein
MSELNIVKYVGIVYNKNNTYNNVTPDDNKNYLTLSNIIINNINNDIIPPVHNHNSGYYIGDKYDDLVKIFKNSELIGSDKTLENNDYPYLYRSSSNNVNPYFILELRPINISLMKNIIIYNSNNVSVLEKFCLVLFNDTRIIKTFSLQTVLEQTIDVNHTKSLNIYDNIDELTVKTKNATSVYLELKESLKNVKPDKSPTVEQSPTVDTKHYNEINAKLNNINSTLNRNILDITNIKNNSNDILSQFNKFKSDILNQISSITINSNLSVVSNSSTQTQTQSDLPVNVVSQSNLPVNVVSQSNLPVNVVSQSDTYNDITNKNNFNRFKRMVTHKII